MDSIGVTVVGMGWMGRVHTQAYLRVPQHYPDLPVPRLIATADEVPGRSTTTDWRELLDDLGSHAVDLVRHLLGEIDEVVGADTAIFIPERPAPSGATTGHERGTGPMRPVENDDWFAALLRTVGGARVVVEASRVAAGEQNHYGFAIHGTRGLLSWDFRRMGELLVDGRPIFAGQARASR